jgi:dTDP-4-amino-4,6-dideoxygalactose transaminase
LPATLPTESPAGDRHAMHLDALLFDLDPLKVDRDAIAHALHLGGIGTGVHYRGVHLQPLYRNQYGYLPARDVPARDAHLGADDFDPIVSVAVRSRRDDVIEAVQQVLTHFAR